MNGVIHRLKKMFVCYVYIYYAFEKASENLSKKPHFEAAFIKVYK